MAGRSFAECEKVGDRNETDRDCETAGGMSSEEDMIAVGVEGDNMSFVRRNLIRRRFESQTGQEIEVRMCLQIHP